MSKLIDADTLILDTEWSEYYDDFMSYSQGQIRDAEEIKAIRLDKVRQARKEIEELKPNNLNFKWYKGETVAINKVLEILDKLIAESEG